MTRGILIAKWFTLTSLLLITLNLQAQQPGESLLPVTTKGYVSVPDPDLLEQQFDKTQLGKLAADPVIKPFAEDLQKQIEAKVGRTEVQLSITLDDVRSICGGEVCIAVIQPDNDPKQHALALLVDTTGREQETAKLLARIDTDLTQQKAEKVEQKVGETKLIVYTLPKKPGETEARQAFYFLHGVQLVASDNKEITKSILDRIGKSDGPCLGTNKVFRAVLDRSKKALGDTKSHISWFIEPFGYVEVMRAAAGGRKKRGTDMLKVIANQGFKAIQGAGGMVAVSTEDADIVHRSYVYAPAVEGAKEKYELAARMLQFPESDKLDPVSWVPQPSANYLALNWKMQEAFEFSKTLVDEAAGAPVFDDVIDSLKYEPNGPQIDIREGLVKHLGERAFFFSDYRLPITPTSERWMLALQVTNSDVVAATLNKAMESDPDAHQREMGDLKVWEIIRPEESEDIELDISGPGFGEFDDFGDDEEEMVEDSAPLLEQAAFAVDRGYLIVASHADYMEDVLVKQAQGALADTVDYQRVAKVLKALGAGENSFRFFTRTDKAYHTTYELIRQGKMPESKSLFGNFLNRAFGPEEEGVLREQEIDGQKMPEFEKVSSYLGPAGVFVDSEDDGWLISGCLLEKREGDREIAADETSESDDKPAEQPKQGDVADETAE